MTAAQRTEFSCEVKEVFSGDDLIVFVDLDAEGLYKKQRVRLAGVDTPNSVGSKDNTEAGEIRREIRMLTRYKPGKLVVVKRNPQSWVVQLTVETPEGPVNVNQMLIDRGYAFRDKTNDKVQA